MRILKDRDGDYWVEVPKHPGHFVLPTDAISWSEPEDSIKRTRGPLAEMRLVEA